MRNREFNVPYVEVLVDRKKTRKKTIALIPSQTHSRTGAALTVAEAWRRGNKGSATHFVVDDTRSYKCFDEKFAGPNGFDKSLSVTVCAEPARADSFWDLEIHQEVLLNTARLVAEICVTKKIDLDLFDSRHYRRKSRLLLAEDSLFPMEWFRREVAIQVTHLERRKKRW